MLAEKKPVIASMADVAASGGYYMAMASGVVLAEPLTITGSIGVVSGMYERVNFLCVSFLIYGVTKSLDYQHAGLYKDVIVIPNARFSVNLLGSQV